MPSKTRLFALTYWLLNAASIVLSVLCGFLVIALMACGVMSVGADYFGIPETIEGLARGNAFLLGAVAIFFALICFALLVFAIRAVTAIVKSARAGDPFVSANADRLVRTAWLLLAINIISGVATGILKILVKFRVPEKIQGQFNFGPQDLHDHFNFNFNVSPVGLFGILLIFVLAQIFRHGSEMRAELDGTV